MRIVLTVVLASWLLVSCAAPSVWERSLHKGPDAAMTLGPTAQPIVRTVPWARVSETASRIEEQIAASDVHPDEWDEGRRLQIKRQLLKGLQVSQPAENVRVVGRAQFRTTESLDGGDGELQRIARELGADMVVWSSRVLGKADKIVNQPVSTNTFGTSRYRYRTEDEDRYDNYNETSTTWVPMRVSVDETGAIAYFLRVGP